MPSPHAHLPDDAGTGAPRESPYRASPVGLDDIDELLEDSDLAMRSPGPAPVRAWRDDLALVLEALRYARAILAADVTVLRHALATGTTAAALVDELPSVLGTQQGSERWSEPAGPHPEDDADFDAEVDPDLFTRADDLVSAHEAMAGLDLSDSSEVIRVLDLIEDTLVAVSAYQAAVELRLSQIRAVILRQYAEGVIPSRDWPG